jgi:hypothetical protein
LNWAIGIVFGVKMNAINWVFGAHAKIKTCHLFNKK